uniref:Glabrous enhancer-binding protein-like DBD domain-containing protein n=1 Tax=Manihot esculenta TaxID=3983 RepID=A0A2C9U4F8_MANES
MEENPLKTTKHRSKSLASTQVAVKSTAAVKRGSETDRDPKESKRSKKKDSESDGSVDKPEDIKKQLFQRLWSEDDEILVLEGIIDFTENKGVDHAKDMNSFFDFIKSSLHFDVSLNQLKDKVLRLKKSLRNMKAKGKWVKIRHFLKPIIKNLLICGKRYGAAKQLVGRSDLILKSNGKE